MMILPTPREQKTKKSDTSESTKNNGVDIEIAGKGTEGWYVHATCRAPQYVRKRERIEEVNWTENALIEQMVVMCMCVCGDAHELKTENLESRTKSDNDDEQKKIESKTP